MRTSPIAIALVCGCILLQWTPTAAAEPPRAYARNPSTMPTVSPYLTLGVNSNGLSNYQTLVRPLLNQREAMTRQVSNAQKVQQQSRETSQGRLAEEMEPRDSRGRGAAGRFMNYSHYFGTAR